MRPKEEEWRDVPGYGGHYQASSRGRVRVKRREVERVNRWGEIATYVYRQRMLRTSLASGRTYRGGYKMVHLGWGGRRQSVAVHIMVLLAFHGPRPAGYFGCHNNSISTDNRPDNLRWDTHHGNMQDRKRIGGYLRGEFHPMAKLSDDQRREIWASSLNTREVVERYGISKTHAHRLIGLRPSEPHDNSREQEGTGEASQT